MNPGDLVSVGTGKTVWVITSFWGGDMATLQRVDRADVHTSVNRARLKARAA